MRIAALYSVKGMMTMKRLLLLLMFLSILFASTGSAESLAYRTRTVFFSETDNSYYLLYRDHGFLISCDKICRIRFDDNNGTTELLVDSLKDILGFFVCGDVLVYENSIFSMNNDVRVLDMETGNNKLILENVYCALGMYNDVVFYSCDQNVYSYDLLTGERQFLFSHDGLDSCKKGFFFRPHHDSDVFDFYEIRSGKRTTTQIDYDGQIEFSEMYYLNKRDGKLYTISGDEVLNLHLTENDEFGITDSYVYRYSSGLLSLWQLSDLSMVNEIIVNEPPAYFSVCGNKVFVYPKRGRRINVLDIVAGDAIEIALP